MSKQRVPVLVAGAGTVGLAAAAFLAQHGVSPLVVERRTGLSDHPRASSIGPRAWEAVFSLGVGAEAEAAAEKRSETHGMIKARTIADADPAEIARKPNQSKAFADPIKEFTPRSDLGGCGQDRLDRILADAYRRHRGAGIRWRTEVVEIRPAADHVEIDLHDLASGEVSTVDAEHVVAADGADSTARTCLGVGSTGPGPVGGYVINVLFRADLSDLVASKGFFSPAFITHPDAAGGLVALGGDRWCYHIQLPGEHDDPLAGYSEQRCREIIRTGLGRAGQELEILSRLPYRFTARLADRFAQGRVHFVGDAAHTLPPAGGFGLSTGLCDAHNLAWKLAMTVAGLAGPRLLESYHAERFPRGRFVFDQAMIRLANPDLHWNPEKATPEARKRVGMVDHSVAHLCELCDSSAVVEPRTTPLSPDEVAANLDGSPGTRVPHAWVERPTGARMSTVDLAGPEFALLTGSQGEPWRDAEAGAAALGVRLAVHVIGPDGDLADPAGRWAAGSGIKPDGAVLVRPDGIIGWRSVAAAEDGPAAVQRALRRILDLPAAGS
ncbi:FAD-dependent monooxygenase [Amycolatopsis sp. NPDC003676]